MSIFISLVFRRLFYGLEINFLMAEDSAATNILKCKLILPFFFYENNKDGEI
jgi:hypothetical protein